MLFSPPYFTLHLAELSCEGGKFFEVVCTGPTGRACVVCAGYLRAMGGSAEAECAGFVRWSS